MITLSWLAGPSVFDPRNPGHLTRVVIFIIFACWRGCRPLRMRHLAEARRLLETWSLLRMSRLKEMRYPLKMQQLMKTRR